MSRRNIYYWKCDRPAAFHGTQTRGEADAQIEQQLREALQQHFDTQAVALSAGAGQGNHLTWNAQINGLPMFLRVENGPEQDAHLAIESALLEHVRAVGVPTPRVHACDATRTRVPFAWQALERISAPDLNHWHKQARLDVPRIAFDIGAAVAHWQQITLPNFGALEDTNVGRVWRQPARLLVGTESSGGSAMAPPALAERSSSNAPTLSGYHATYADYFHLRLDQHLAFLVTHGFLTQPQRDEILVEIEHHQSLLHLDTGCFVHKDLALWNILGTETQIAAFIDFDDAISGDPMDDLSLLACFHDAAFLSQAFAGYQTIRALPTDHLRRFWLHLLRNMIVKAVIRVGAGYFDRDDGFFLISSGTSGQSLRAFTLSRLNLALQGLRNSSSIDILRP
ncbi:aminoglycoside phosphotransferase family protein [Prosthecobacter sp.]|uniref:phosphotransferase family protein n=1 Tax=Prosthecobacter sp. TaxID=1965333 RepID=UPI00248920B4|nr:aminoglycoside phosphotransferase family protein [Prosthecobacter sp.]MDI1313793.1 aminoglycoside phosphotransferase family protein [Prosthecobacter sp.]